MIAVGANATGIIAIGQLATGVIAVGQLARGVFVLGQLAVGVFTVGQLAIGVVSAGGQIGVALRRRFGVVWAVRPQWLVIVLAVVWWLAAGMWLWDAATREGGIFRDAPVPVCADQPGRAC